MTAPYTKTVWVDDSPPAISATNLGHLEQGVYDATEGVRALEAAPPGPSVVTPAQFTALTPTDGMEVYLEVSDGVGGSWWHLRYRASSGSPYKWEFLGGPPISNFSDPGVGFTVNTGPFQEPDTNCRLTIPRPGDYMIFGSCRTNVTGASILHEMAVRHGASSDVQVSQFRSSGSTASVFAHSGWTVHGGCAAGDIATVVVKADTGTSPSCGFRKVMLYPIRVSQ